MKIFRLPLALSFIGHVAALALVAWLSTGAPPTPDPAPLQTIPLLFVEPSSLADAAVPASRAAPASSEVPPSLSAEDPAGAKPTAEASIEKPLGDPPLAFQVSKVPEPSPSTIAAEDHTEAEVPSVSQASADALPAPAPSDPVLSSSPQPAPHAERQTRPLEKAASPRRGSEKPAENPPSVMQTEHPKRHRAAVSSAKRDSNRDPDAASKAGALALPKVTERRTAQSSPSPPVAALLNPATTAAYPTASQRANLPLLAASPPAPASTVPAAPAAISAEYRQALSLWLERNKIYPDAARQRGEEGTALLRFQVRRDGYVLAYQLTRSTGHAALDEAVERMMRGARLPPFPAGMTQAEIAVSVPIRFNLSR